MPASKIYNFKELDLQDLHYLLNLLHTICNEVALKERFLDTEFECREDRSTILRCKYKLEVFLASNQLKPKILGNPFKDTKNAKRKAKLLLSK